MARITHEAPTTHQHGEPADDAISVVFLADTYLIGAGMHCLLERIDDVRPVGHATDPDQLQGLVDELRPDVVLLCIRSSLARNAAVVAAGRRLRDDHPDLGIVVVSDRGATFAVDLLGGGADRTAYLLDEHITDLDRFVTAIRDVRAGRSVIDPAIIDALVQRRDAEPIDALTARETDVLELLTQGLSNRAIAEEVYLSRKAVEKHVSNIFRKLDLVDHTAVDRRVTAALTFLRARENAVTFSAPDQSGPP